MMNLHGVWSLQDGFCLWSPDTPPQTIADAIGLPFPSRPVGLTLHLPDGPRNVAALTLSSIDALRLPAHFKGTPRPGLRLQDSLRALLNLCWLLLRQLA
ncbi:MAG: hypothetical protein AAFV53_36565, partial [Myxococcota bacterium]